MTTTLDYKQTQNKQNNKHTHENKMSQMINFKTVNKCQQQAYSMYLQRTHSMKLYLNEAFLMEGCNRS